MQQRIIPFATMTPLLQYARMLADLAGAEIMFVMPNAVVIQYNGQVVMMVTRDEEGG